MYAGARSNSSISKQYCCMSKQSTVQPEDISASCRYQARHQHDAKARSLLSAHNITANRKCSSAATVQNERPGRQSQGCLRCCVDAHKTVVNGQRQGFPQLSGAAAQLLQSSSTSRQLSQQTCYRMLQEPHMLSCYCAASAATAAGVAKQVPRQQQLASWRCIKMMGHVISRAPLCSVA
jgi:hypothetical protein